MTKVSKSVYCNDISNLYLYFTDVSISPNTGYATHGAVLELWLLLLVLDDLDPVPEPQAVAAVDGAEHEPHRRPRQDPAEDAALARHRNLRRVPLNLALLAAEGQHGPDRGQDLLRDGSCGGQGGVAVV